MKLLHSLDSIVRSFFSRLPDFSAKPPTSLKSIAKAYYEAKYRPEGGYVLNYRIYEPLKAKIEYLDRRGLYETNLTEKQIVYLFERVKRQHLSSLEVDVGTFS